MCLDNNIDNFYAAYDNYNTETFESEFCDNCNEVLNDSGETERTCNQCAFEALEESNLFSIKDSSFQITALPSLELVQAANEICRDIFESDSFYVQVRHIEEGYFAICIHYVDAVPPLEIIQDEEGLSLKIGGLKILSQDFNHALAVIFSLHNKKQQQRIKIAA